MKSLRNQLKKGVQHVCLSRDERELMREHLVQYMEYLPISRSQAVVPSAQFRIPFRFLLGRKHLFGSLAIALMVTTTTAGVSSAASEALPGDFLYTVKVNVNEGVKSAFITSNEDRIKWEQERTRMRLEEANRLALEGRLDTELQTEVTKRISAHTDAVVERVRTIEETNPALAVEVASELEDTLEAHSAMLVRISVEHNEEMNTDTREFVMQMHKTAGEVATMRSDVEERLLLVDEEVVVSTSLAQNEDAAEAGPDGGPDSLTSATPTNEMHTLTQVAGADGSESVREEVARRASLRAETQLERTIKLLQVRAEGESEQIALLEEQIERGQKQIEFGTEAFKSGKYQTAYNAFRGVATHFQKIADTIAVADKFALEPYTGLTFADMEESFPYGVGGMAEEVGGIVSEQETVHVVPEVDEQELRAEVQESIAHIRALTTPTQDMSEEAPTQQKIRGMVNDVTSDALRGEMYLDAGASVKGIPLLTHAKKRISEIEALMQSDVMQATGTEPTTTTAPDNPVVPVSIPETQEDAERPLVVWHTYTDEGVHTFVGTISPSKCDAFSSRVLVSSTIPQSLTLAFETTDIEGETCADETVEHGYYASTTAMGNATLKTVTMNGVDIPWVFGEYVTPSTDGLGNSAVSEPVASTTMNMSLLNRTIRSVQSLLDPSSTE